VFHRFGGLGNLFGRGQAHQTPVATELVTKRHLLKKLSYQTMPNSSE